MQNIEQNHTGYTHVYSFYTRYETWDQIGEWLNSGYAKIKNEIKQKSFTILGFTQSGLEKKVT